MPLVRVSGVGLYSLLGYPEEMEMLAASFSVGWTVLLQTREGAVCTIDYCPAAVSFAAVAAIVAVAWLLSLPLT